VHAKCTQLLLLIRQPPCYAHTVKYDKSICNYRGKKRKKLRKKVKDPLSIEIWIFRNGQPDRDHDDKMFVAMTST
jgi:hypothetical protein